MLGRASFALASTAHSSRRVLSAPSTRLSPAFVRRFAYGNENKPESKETANEQLKEAAAGKSAAEVKQHKASTGGKPLARESGAAGAKATLDNAVRHSLRNATRSGRAEEMKSE